MRRMLEMMFSSWRLSEISRLASMRAFWRSGRLSNMRMFEPASLMTAVISASKPARSRARTCNSTGKVVVALHDQRSLAHAQHALYGLYQRGLRVLRGLLRFLAGFTEVARQHLPRGIFPEADGGVQIVEFRQAVFGTKFLQVLSGDFLHALGEIARLVFEQP